ncbi:MAG: hypothetical protein NTY30_01210 [Candidatus Berkelbacteria bacterium]|nr:hypothetical protein [Candidatus Berkelbacteria bacterium]
MSTTTLSGVDVGALGRDYLEDFQDLWMGVRSADEAIRLLRAIPHLVPKDPNKMSWKLVLMRANCLLPMLVGGPQGGEARNQQLLAIEILGSKILSVPQQVQDDLIANADPSTINKMIAAYQRWDSSEDLGHHREVRDTLKVIGDILEKICDNVIFGIYAERYTYIRLVTGRERYQKQRQAFRALVSFATESGLSQPLTKYALPDTAKIVAKHTQDAVKKALRDQRPLATREQRIKVLVELNVLRHDHSAGTTRQEKACRALDMLMLYDNVSLIADYQEMFLQRMGQ